MSDIITAAAPLVAVAGVAAKSLVSDNAGSITALGWVLIAACIDGMFHGGITPKPWMRDAFISAGSALLRRAFGGR